MPGGGADLGAGASGMGSGNTGGNTGGNGDNNREQYGAVGQYSGGTTSTSNDGGRDPTKQYENLPKDYNLETDNPDAYKALAAQRQKAQYEISPMTDPKNKAIAMGLSFLIPGAGSLYGAYKNATAMGYSIQNPFEGLLGSGEITIDKVNQAIERGDGDNFNISEAVAAAPSIIQGNTQEPSVAAAWYKNLGTTSGWDPFSTNSLFANARAKQQSILGTATGIGQMAVNESPFFNFLKDNSINKGIL